MTVRNDLSLLNWGTKGSAILIPMNTIIDTKRVSYRNDVSHYYYFQPKKGYRNQFQSEIDYWVVKYLLQCSYHYKEKKAIGFLLAVEY